MHTSFLPSQQHTRQCKNQTPTPDSNDSGDSCYFTDASHHASLSHCSSTDSSNHWRKPTDDSVAGQRCVSQSEHGVASPAAQGEFSCSNSSFSTGESSQLPSAEAVLCVSRCMPKKNRAFNERNGSCSHEGNSTDRLTRFTSASDPATAGRNLNQRAEKVESDNGEQPQSSNNSPPLFSHPPKKRKRESPSAPPQQQQRASSSLKNCGQRNHHHLQMPSGSPSSLDESSLPLKKQKRYHVSNPEHFSNRGPNASHTTAHSNSIKLLVNKPCTRQDMQISVLCNHQDQYPVSYQRYPPLLSQGSFGAQHFSSQHNLFGPTNFQSHSGVMSSVPYQGRQHLVLPSVSATRPDSSCSPNVPASSQNAFIPRGGVVIATTNRYPSHHHQPPPQQYLHHYPSRQHQHQIDVVHAQNNCRVHPPSRIDACISSQKADSEQDNNSTGELSVSPKSPSSENGSTNSKVSLPKDASTTTSTCASPKKKKHHTRKRKGATQKTKKQKKKEQKAKKEKKTHECDQCFKKFDRAADLTTHYRTHTGERPFKCDICDKAFTTNSNMHRHKNIHSDVRRFSCPLCFKTFKQKSHLKRHQQIHEKDK